jgi:hypothetical protein
MPAIQPITDELLITAIRRASERVVLISPGVWAPVAEAVAAAWEKLGRDRVTVILDVDPEICRIGYGSLKGIEILQTAAAKQGEALGQEPGIRICVFIVDQETFVFSPTPRQLEVPPGETSPGTPVTPSQPKANGIVLSRPPEKLAAELGGGDEGITQRKLGLEPLSKEKLKDVTEDLAKNPPKNFDLARAVNVYNARVQFVELKLGGCKLSEHKAQLPKHLIHVLKKNPALSRKIENSIKLLDDEDGLVTDKTLSQDTLFTHREKIHEQYLRPVKGVGTVIERAKKADFSKEVESLKAEVEKFAKSVEAKLAERFQQTAEQLADEILDEVLADLPERWRKKLGSHPDPQRVRWYVLEDLLKAFGTPAGKVGKMKVETVFKDVTYDMLNEPEFREQMAEYFPDLPLMEEFKAAKERPAAAKGAQQELLP